MVCGAGDWSLANIFVFHHVFWDSEFTDDGVDLTKMCNSGKGNTE